MERDSFFAQTTLDLSACNGDAECDAALGAYLLRYLRHSFDENHRAWLAPEPHDTLRRTCHAAEVLHQLDLDSHTEGIVRKAGTWLINLKIRFDLPRGKRDEVRLYPSRFKTLAYLRQFEQDALSDFVELLDLLHKGTRDAAIECNILNTCIALDTLLTLREHERRLDARLDAHYKSLVRVVRREVRAWHKARASESVAQVAPHGGQPAAKTALVATEDENRLAIHNMRDLSYALGLLLRTGRSGLVSEEMSVVLDSLVATVERRDRETYRDIVHVLYAALNLAEQRHNDDIQHAALPTTLRRFLDDLRVLYVRSTIPRQWDLVTHVLVLRLLLAYYGPAVLARGIAAHLLHDAEHRERMTLETDLQHVIRDRMSIQLGEIEELSGGFTDDRVFRVPFTYSLPLPDQPSRARPRAVSQPLISLIVKQSTSSALHTAMKNYNRLSPELQQFFARQPTEAEIYKARDSLTYYLPMEDLYGMRTLYDHLNEWDQPVMEEMHRELLHTAVERVARVSCTLFETTRGKRIHFPGTQHSRLLLSDLYRSRIESKLARGVNHIPWLKKQLDGFSGPYQRFRSLDHYLNIITAHAPMMEPAYLGLVHGDFHARNIMLDDSCGQAKLIDLDKLSWSGDYLADLGDLIADTCIYRRVSEPEREEYGLPSDDITLSANGVHYPILSRPATDELQLALLAALGRFAAKIEDTGWKPRLWLATATGLLRRIAFHTDGDSEKDALIVAVLYSEAVRLLDELSGFLVRAEKGGAEGGATLPYRLVPLAAPIDVPEWVARQELLRTLDGRLCKMGLRHRGDQSGIVRYYPGSTEQICGELLPPQGVGLAVLRLRRSAAVTLPKTELHVDFGGAADDRSDVLITLQETTKLNEVLRLAHVCLNGKVSH
ncbi:MAG: phosphotransferase [Ktedonobacterales bacterium]